MLSLQLIQQLQYPVAAKKLRLFVFSRVETIRRMIEWTTGRDYLPIYHVDGTMNLADLLTKKHNLKVEDLSTGSDL